MHALERVDTSALTSQSRSEAVASPVITRDSFDTDEPEVANAALGRMYGDVRSWVFGNPEGFTYRLRSGAAAATASSPLASAHMSFTMGFGIDADLAPSHHTLLAMLGGDRYHIKSQYGDVVLRPGGLAVVPAGAALQVSLHALDVITLSIPTEDLSRVAEETYGTRATDFALTDMAAVSATAARYLHRLTRVACSELLAADSALEHPILRQQTVHALCAAFLTAFPTTAAADQHPAGPGDLTPRALRRAIAYIDDHAAQPISLTDIAAAARVSSRALQHAFAQHLDTTPTAYLRRVRLEHAHRELRAADPTRGDTVGGIAQKWGFAKPGRFATAYRAVYGRNPGQTLRN